MSLQETRVGVQFYNFETVFSAAPEAVLGPDATNASVQAVVQEAMRFPEDHDFRVVGLIGAAAVAVAEGGEMPTKQVSYAATSTFVDWEGDTPEARVATIGIDVYAPGIISRAVAWARRKKAQASVNVYAYGHKPMGGGDLKGNPDDAPLPVTSPRDLVHA